MRFTPYNSNVREHLACRGNLRMWWVMKNIWTIFWRENILDISWTTFYVFIGLRIGQNLRNVRILHNYSAPWDWFEKCLAVTTVIFGAFNVIVLNVLIAVEICHLFLQNVKKLFVITYPSKSYAKFPVRYTPKVYDMSLSITFCLLDERPLIARQLCCMRQGGKSRYRRAFASTCGYALFSPEPVKTPMGAGPNHCPPARQIWPPFQSPYSWCTVR